MSIILRTYPFLAVLLSVSLLSSAVSLPVQSWCAMRESVEHEAPGARHGIASLATAASRPASPCMNTGGVGAQHLPSVSEAGCCCMIHQVPRSRTPADAPKTVLHDPVLPLLALSNPTVRDDADDSSPLIQALVSALAPGSPPSDRQALLATFLI